MSNHIKNFLNSLYDSLRLQGGSEIPSLCPHIQELFNKALENGHALPLSDIRINFLKEQLLEKISSCVKCSKCFNNKYSTNLPNKKQKTLPITESHDENENQNTLLYSNLPTCAPIRRPLLLTDKPYYPNFADEISNTSDSSISFPSRNYPLLLTNEPHWKNNPVENDKMDIDLNDSNCNLYQFNNIQSIDYNQYVCAFEAIHKESCVLNEVTNTITLSCGHRFHLECIITFQYIALKNNNSTCYICPICRTHQTRLSTKRNHFDYLHCSNNKKPRIENEFNDFISSRKRSLYEEQTIYQKKIKI